MTANADHLAAGAALRTTAPDSADAEAELRRIAAVSRDKISSENFPVALRVLPRRPREQLVRVYAFARFVDDVGDAARGDRLALLDAVDADITALSAGTARLQAVRDLAPLLANRTFTVQPLRDLVAANRRDQTVTSYETFDDLLGYCSLSAAPVGRLVLAIAGVDDSVAIARSDEVCAALQVLEHCQDVGEDARAGRVYLPVVDLRAAHVDVTELQTYTTSAALRSVVAQQVARAQDMLAAGRPLVRSLSGWARVAVAGYVAGGRATASALQRADYDVLATAVRPRRGTTVRRALLLAAGR